MFVPATSTSPIIVSSTAHEVPTVWFVQAMAEGEDRAPPPSVAETGRVVVEFMIAPEAGDTAEIIRSLLAQVGVPNSRLMQGRRTSKASAVRAKGEAEARMTVIPERIDQSSVANLAAGPREEETEWGPPQQFAGGGKVDDAAAPEGHSATPLTNAPHVVERQEQLPKNGEMDATLGSDTLRSGLAATTPAARGANVAPPQQTAATEESFCTPRSSPPRVVPGIGTGAEASPTKRVFSAMASIFSFEDADHEAALRRAEEDETMAYYRSLSASSPGGAARRVCCTCSTHACTGSCAPDRTTWEALRRDKIESRRRAGAEEAVLALQRDEATRWQSASAQQQQRRRGS